MRTLKYVLKTFSASDLFSFPSLSSSLPLSFFLSFSEGLPHWFIMLMINQIEAAVWESRSAWAFHCIGPDWARGSWNLFRHLLEIWDIFCLSFPPLLYQGPFHNGKVTATLSTLKFALALFLSFPPILFFLLPLIVLFISNFLTRSTNVVLSRSFSTLFCFVVIVLNN